MDGIFNLIGIVEWIDDKGDPRGEICVEDQRIIAGSADCARDRFREDNGPDIKKAREKGKIRILCHKFNNC